MLVPMVPDTWQGLRGDPGRCTAGRVAGRVRQRCAGAGRPGPGWTASPQRGPPSRRTRVSPGWSPPLLKRLPDDDRPVGAVWASSCLIVRPEFRARGMSRTLLDGAVDYARPRVRASPREDGAPYFERKEISRIFQGELPSHGVNIHISVLKSHHRLRQGWRHGLMMRPDRRSGESAVCSWTAGETAG
jgi:hypothetical protein